MRVSQVSAFTDDNNGQPQLNAEQLAINVQQKVPNHYQPQPCMFHIFTQCNNRTISFERSFVAIRKTEGINETVMPSA